MPKKTPDNEGLKVLQANTLAYKGKKLAAFDETDPSMQFDLGKLKAVTGGSTKMSSCGIVVI